MNHKFKVADLIENMTFKDVESADGIKINDYIIQYIGDSLEWLNTSWNQLDYKNTGLNYYGVTFIIDKENILKMKEILTSWNSLFNNAPLEFTISADYNTDELMFEKIEMKKSEVISEIKDVITLCDQALKEDKILIHFGI